MSKKVFALENLDLDFSKKIDNQVQALVKAIQKAVEISIPMVKICSILKPGFTLWNVKKQRWKRGDFEKYLSNWEQKKPKKNIRQLI